MISRFRSEYFYIRNEFFKFRFSLTQSTCVCIFNEDILIKFLRLNLFGDLERFSQARKSWVQKYGANNGVRRCTEMSDDSANDLFLRLSAFSCALAFAKV